MQQYAIGRDDSCQIRLNDQSQRISRNHATLKVLDNGKIFITDHSSNGTYVNGVRISQGVDFPIKRGDTVSFANVVELNWELIPKRSYKGILYSIIAVAVVAAAVIGFKIYSNNESPILPEPLPIEEANDVDSTKIKKEQEEQRLKDIDSQKQRDDSIANKARIEERKKMEDEKRKKEAKEEQERREEEKRDSTKKITKIIY